MSYVKQNFVDGQTLTAAQLNHMEAGIANADVYKRQSRWCPPHSLHRPP